MGIRLVAGAAFLTLAMALCSGIAACSDSERGAGDRAVDRVTGNAEQQLSTDAGTPSPCAAPPSGTQLCADFDHVAAVADGWRVVSPGGGRGELDHHHFVSGPASYKAIAPYAQEADVVPVRGNLSLELDLRIDHVESFDAQQPSAGEIARITDTKPIPPGGRFVLFTVTLDANRHLFVNEIIAGFHVFPHDLGQLAKKTWVHLRIAESGAHFQASVDGVQKMDVVPANAPASSGLRTLSVGAQDDRVSFDNIVLGDPVPVVDAGPDTGSSFCTSQPSTTLFCDDFDHATEPSGFCDVLDTTTFTSAPFSCKRTTTTLPGLTESLTTTNPSASLDVDLLLGAAPTALSQWAEISTNAAHPPAGQCPNGVIPCNITVILQVDATSTLSYLVQDFTVPPSRWLTGPLGTIALDTWTHVKAVLTGDTMQILVNGVSKVSTFPGAHTVPGTVTFALTPRPGMSFDNLVLGQP